MQLKATKTVSCQCINIDDKQLRTNIYSFVKDPTH